MNDVGSIRMLVEWQMGLGRGVTIGAGSLLSSVADPCFALRATQDAVGEAVSNEWRGCKRNSPVLGTRSG